MAPLRSRLSSPRMRGSSTPRPLDSITAVSGILDRPLSRAMTVEGVAQLRDLAARSARALLSSFLTLRSEGAGNAGRPMRPRPRVHFVVVERTRVTTSTPESPGIPRAMVYGLFRALPGEPGFLATIARGSHRELDASVGASGPHVFAVRLSAPRPRAPPRPPHPAPRW